MNGIEIFPAGLSELDELIAWRENVLREIFSLPDITDISGLLRANKEYYRAALTKGTHIACFAKRNGEAVGCGGVCLYREMPSPDNPNGLCAYLMNIYVLPSCRHRQVGRSIVRWLVFQAKQRGCSKIYLETSEAGRNMYRTIGFTEMNDLMTLRIKNGI